MVFNIKQAIKEKKSVLILFFSSTSLYFKRIFIFSSHVDEYLTYRSHQRREIYPFQPSYRTI